MYSPLVTSLLSLAQNKEDERAFLFTLKNPHGVPPTRFMKSNDYTSAITCDSQFGPVFGSRKSPALLLGPVPSIENSCYVCNNGTNGYECDSTLKSSLFVHTADPDNHNSFSVSDYEVFSLQDKQEYIKGIAHYPEVLWEYVQTKKINPSTIAASVVDDTLLYHDLSLLELSLSASEKRIISKASLLHPSALLPGTQIVDSQYDLYFQQWLGDHVSYQFLYRASDHHFLGDSFHQYCDDKGPTLVIIKSSEGWIFGGYTSKSWKCTTSEGFGMLNSYFSLMHRGE